MNSPLNYCFLLSYCSSSKLFLPCRGPRLLGDLWGRTAHVGTGRGCPLSPGLAHVVALTEAVAEEEASHLQKLSWEDWVWGRKISEANQSAAQPEKTDPG